MSASPAPAVTRSLGPNAGTRAVDVVGGQVPLDTEEFARRAYLHAKNPLRNPLKEVMDAFQGNVLETPPMLGIFSDVPWHQLKESDVVAWAKAGFTWVVPDGEHQQMAGRYGREQNAMMLRNGILPVQRLHREARSEHGDALTMGARATMIPYGTTPQEAQDYYRCVTYPTEGAATPLCRGGFPMRTGDYNLLFTPKDLKAGETETQGWVQFETMEYIKDKGIRDQVFDVMQKQGPNKACGFVGPFDAVMRGGADPGINDAISDLFSEAAKRGLYMGRVCGSGSCSTPEAIEEAMVSAIKSGCRLICVHYMTSDMTFHGAEKMAAPFWRACERCQVTPAAAPAGEPSPTPKKRRTEQNGESPGWVGEFPVKF